MKNIKFLSCLLLVLMGFQISLAAPHYTGIGCNEEGTRCALGWPTHRVLEWSMWGLKSEMGDRCEKFINQLDSDLKTIEQRIQALGNFKFTNFTYEELTDSLSGEKNVVVCRVHIHSEKENVKIYDSTGESKYWVLFKMSEQNRQICYSDPDSRECVQALISVCDDNKIKVKEDENLLSAQVHVVLSGSLTQGDICVPRFVEVRIEENKNN